MIFIVKQKQATFNQAQQNRLLRCPTIGLHFVYGIHSPFHVCVRNQSDPCLGRRYTFPNQYDCLFNLNVIWLKLLIPWRLFRLWALTDGIDPPENMLRCMNNNYSALSFWRSWHRSFNKWITRYIYIPLGGSRKQPIINSFIVFSFVAIWHDIQLRLLLWGWLVVIFILPELLATVIFPAKKVSFSDICFHALFLN